MRAVASCPSSESDLCLYVYGSNESAHSNGGYAEAPQLRKLLRSPAVCAARGHGWLPVELDVRRSPRRAVLWLCMDGCCPRVLCPEKAAHKVGSFRAWPAGKAEAVTYLLSLMPHSSVSSICVIRVPWANRLNWPALFKVKPDALS